MTVISALFKPEFIIVTTDSMITSIEDGKKKADKNSYQHNLKHVAYPQLRCIASYFGLATITYGNQRVWDTITWLKSKVENHSEFNDILSFGEHLRDELYAVFNGHTFSSERSIGIHLTGFEYFNGKWVPEMFYVSGDSRSKTAQVSRRSYLDWKQLDFDQSVPLDDQREEFYELISRQPFFYNNGDNVLYNNFLRSYSNALTEAHTRGVLSGGIGNESYYIKLSQAPLKAIRAFQKTYFIKESIVVGGKIRTIIMYPDGQTKNV